MPTEGSPRTQQPTAISRQENSRSSLAISSRSCSIWNRLTSFCKRAEMPTKTDRILSYLPRTFQTSPRPPVLYSLVDAFGNELLLGENSLAAVMLAHWVDFADTNAAEINDLEKLASLYGLAPRRDDDEKILETVEEFREHLKHYVRTFLEGTTTVQGILRISAEALALHI